MQQHLKAKRVGDGAAAAAPAAEPRGQASTSLPRRRRGAGDLSGMVLASACVLGLIFTAWVVVLNRWQLQLNSNAIEGMLAELIQLRQARAASPNCPPHPTPPKRCCDFGASV